MNTVLMSLLCLTVAYHSYLGVQVVIEDYVHGHGYQGLLADRLALRARIRRDCVRVRRLRTGLGS